MCSGFFFNKMGSYQIPTTKMRMFVKLSITSLLKFAETSEYFLHRGGRLRRKNGIYPWLGKII